MLLRRGDYSTGFLTQVGDDLYGFDRTHSSAYDRHLPVWRDTMTIGVRLNWIDGYGDASPAGYDPMTGLMDALSRNSEAAKDFFTADATSGDGPGRLTRVDYLVTDRQWFADGVVRPLTDPDSAGPSGVSHLGLALEEATLDHPDMRSVRIVESVVHEIGTDEQAKGYLNQDADQKNTQTFSRTDVMRPELRQSVGRILGGWIGSVDGSFDNTDVRLDHPAPYDLNHILPGMQRYNAVFDRQDLTMVLADVGKDDSARATVWRAESLYTTLRLENNLRDGLTDAAHRHMERTGIVSGQVFGALDFGHATAIDTASAVRDHAASTPSDLYNAAGFLAEHGGNLAANAFPVAGEVASIGLDEAMSQYEHSLHQDHTGQVNYDIGRVQINGQKTAEALTSAVLYKELPVDQLPPELRDGGVARPMSTWERDDTLAWQSQLDPGGKLESVRDAVDLAGEHYRSGYGAAMMILEGLRGGGR